MLIWASKRCRSRHTFDCDLINSPNPSCQVYSVWRIPTVFKHEKLHGYHLVQKPLRLFRRALQASTREGDFVFGPLTSPRTITIAAMELNHAFVGVQREEEFAKPAARRVAAPLGDNFLREFSEQFWGASS